MKKIISIILALMMALSLAACGGQAEPGTSDSTNETSVSSVDTEDSSLPEEDSAEYGSEYPEDTGSAEVSEDWPFTDYAKPENCEIGDIEDWGSFAKVYVTWESKDAAKAYKDALGLSGGTTADIEGAYEYNSSKLMISYSETNSLANFITIYK